MQHGVQIKRRNALLSLFKEIFSGTLRMKIKLNSNVFYLNVFCQKTNNIKVLTEYGLRAK